MDRLSALKNLKPARAAAVLFWINLLPAAAQATLIALFIAGNIPVTGNTFLGLIVLLLGLAAQVIYFLQFNFSKYADNKSLWMFSMIYHALCILTCLVIVVMSHIVGLIYLVIYPSGLFYLSYLSYNQLKRKQ